MRLGALIGTSALAVTPQAFAQDETPDDELANVEIEEIIVTGSRIKRAGVDTFYPAISVGTEELEDGAFTNIADALNEIPSFGTPDASPFGNQNTFSTGQNFVDFLGLGSQRTLTLVNGRRFVAANTPTLFGENGGLQVDYNVIPVALVERIETIGVGGAPIYGSDAIAGTINVILKDRFEGVQVSMRRGTTSEGDADFESISLVAGANFSDDRGNVTLSMESFRQDGLIRNERPRYTANDPYFGSEEDHDDDDTTDDVRQIYRNQRLNIFSEGGLAGVTGTCPFSFWDTCPIPSFGIGAFPDGNFYQFDSNSNLVPFTPGEATPGSFFFAGGGDGPDFFDNVTQIQSPLNREVFTARMNYDVADRVTFNADMLFANSWSEQLLTQGGFQTYAFGGTSHALVFPSDYPFLTQQAMDLLADNGLDEFSLHRFNNDIIDPSNQREQYLWHATAGLEGDFDVGDRNFVWSITASHGESDSRTVDSAIIDDRFLNAIDVRRLTAEDFILDDGGTPNDPSDDVTITEKDILGVSGTASAGVGDIVCEAAYQVAAGNLTGTSGSGVTDADLPFIQGCVPLNLLGMNARSEAAREWVTGDNMTVGTIEQSVFNVNFGGDLFELPAGWLAFNVGYETREESALFTPGTGAALAIHRGSPFDETGGSYETDEIYGEVAIPVISDDLDIPFMEFLELNGAFREIDNSLAGDQSVWTAGIRFAPVSDIQFRANYTESIRAPSLVELFAPQAQVFNFANDPCDNRYVEDGPVPATREANCAADIANYDPDEFTSNIVNATAIGKSGGNPNLLNESAESYAIGLTWEPRWVENLLFTADYVNIDLTDAIQALTLTQQMTSCYDSTSFPNVPSCSAFVRNSEGQVVDFTTGQTNAAQFLYEQMEYTVQYDFMVADLLGRFNDAWGARDLGNFETRLRFNNPLERVTSVVGEATSPTIGSFTDPEWSGVFDFIWTGENTRVFWRTIWQNKAKLSVSGDTLYIDPNGNFITKTDGRAITNVSIAYNLDSFMPGAPERTMIQLSIGNLFDREPDLFQEAAGHFGNAEWLGRTFTLTLQGNW